MKRYQIRWASLDPTQGAEMAKMRAVVIVSLDTLNDKLQTVTICPLTSQLHPAWRSRLQVRCNRQDAEIAADRIRTISKSRLGTKIGDLTEDEAAASVAYVKEQMGQSSIKVTVDAYGHLVPSANRQAVNRLPVPKSATQAQPAPKEAERASTYRGTLPVYCWIF